ncbi:MAG: hypothetical protein PHP31_08950 [Lentimicrobiaceae bacterium]|nr:hypothetical protein [Lentimicrobiaceae bacterium]
MKTYVLIISSVYPKTHFRAGESTHFSELIKIGQICNKCIHSKLIRVKTTYDIDCKIEQCEHCWVSPKIHTIRANFPLWAKRFEQIENGTACLSLRVWLGKPYRSKQQEIFKLTKVDGIGLQKLNFFNDHVCIIDDKVVSFNREIFSSSGEYIALNDGLYKDEFVDWFKHYDKTNDFALIHFTKFRY